MAIDLSLDEMIVNILKKAPEMEQLEMREKEMKLKQMEQQQETQKQMVELMKMKTVSQQMTMINHVISRLIEK